MNDRASGTDTASVGSALQDDPARRLGWLWRAGQRPDLRQFLAEVGALSPGRLAEVLRVDQRECWRIGRRVPAFDYLDAHPQLRDDPEAAVELIYAEYLLREEAGESPACGENAATYPEYADRLSLQIELHRAFAPSIPSAGATAPLSTTWPVFPQSATEARSGGGYEIMGELGRGGMGWCTRHDTRASTASSRSR